MGERYAVWTEAPQPTNLLESFDLTFDGGIERYKHFLPICILWIIGACFIPYRYIVVYLNTYWLTQIFMSWKVKDDARVWLMVERGGKKLGSDKGRLRLDDDGGLRFRGNEISITLSADELAEAPSPRKILGLDVSESDRTQLTSRQEDFVISFRPVRYGQNSLERDFKRWLRRGGSVKVEILPPQEKKPHVPGSRRSVLLFILFSVVFFTPGLMRIEGASSFQSLAVSLVAMIIIGICFSIPLKRRPRPVSS